MSTHDPICSVCSSIRIPMLGNCIWCASHRATAPRSHPMTNMAACSNAPRDDNGTPGRYYAQFKPLRNEQVITLTAQQEAEIDKIMADADSAILREMREGVEEDERRVRGAIELGVMTAEVGGLQLVMLSAVMGNVERQIWQTREVERRGLVRRLYGEGGK
ncbi:hypothetical protein BDW59DRAFT_166363 [Aspergillus cavernicola]|uniref:Uncharacterized protein n=1 Tax=Aspergillus cavernicola TaxID=176166 RepID=A0ABR4HLR8_9EURO